MLELCEEKPDREGIVRLILSFNEPMIAPHGHHVQQTQCYICTFKEGEEFSVYVYLYLTIEKTGVIYKHSGKITTDEERRTAEGEAMQFAEEMGFMMDELKFASLEPSQQDKLLASIPLFTQATSEVPLKENVEEKGATEKGEGLWEPEAFLSKFRIRAAAERMEKSRK